MGFLKELFWPKFLRGSKDTLQRRAYPIYMKIQGRQQGQIAAGACSSASLGSYAQLEHEDEILVQNVRHCITVPLDRNCGQPIGASIHAPIVVTKFMDKSSPLLYRALTSGEALPSVEILWYKRLKAKKFEVFSKTVLEDAVIVEMGGSMLNLLTSEKVSEAGLVNLEEVFFSYAKITWEHVIARTISEDRCCP